MSQVETQRFHSEGAWPGPGVVGQGGSRGLGSCKEEGGCRAELSPHTWFLRQTHLSGKPLSPQKEGTERLSALGGLHPGAGSMGMQRSVPAARPHSLVCVACDLTDPPAPRHALVGKLGVEGVERSG